MLLVVTSLVAYPVLIDVITTVADLCHVEVTLAAVCCHVVLSDVITRTSRRVKLCVFIPIVGCRGPHCHDTRHCQNQGLHRRSDAAGWWRSVATDLTVLDALRSRAVTTINTRACATVRWRTVGTASLRAIIAVVWRTGVSPD